MQRTSEENWHLTAAYEPAQCNHLARLLSHNKASAVQVAAAKQADHHNQIGWVHVTKLHKCMQTDSKWCRCESNRRNLAIGILHVDICLCHQRNKTHQCHLLMRLQIATALTWMSPEMIPISPMTGKCLLKHLFIVVSILTVVTLCNYCQHSHVRGICSCFVFLSFSDSCSAPYWWCMHAMVLCSFLAKLYELCSSTDSGRYAGWRT